MRRLAAVLLALTLGVLSGPWVATQVIQMVIPGGPTLPATCSVRNAFFKTGSGVGLYVCTATNTWYGPLIEVTGGGGAPTDATYITQTANGSLSAEQALGLLATGILKSTTTTGVVSIATAGTDYLSPTGSGAGLTNLPWASLTGVPAAVTALSGTNTGDQNLWASFIVSGQTTLTTASTTQALTIVAGSGIVLTTDNTAKSLTITGSGSGAPTDAEYWVGAANGSLSAEKNLGALATALVLNTGGTPSAYGGIDCTNQFVRDVAITGAGTCASIVLTADVTGDLPFANLAQASGASVLLGRGDSGAGDFQEISLGSGLTMTGTTLSASGSGGAPDDATYILQVADGDLANAQALSALSSGIMRVATTTGVITALTDCSGIAANQSDETGTCGGLVLSDSPVFVDDFDLMATGVRFTGADGVLTLLGLGNGNDENLTIDLDNGSANQIPFDSGTGVTRIVWNPGRLTLGNVANGNGANLAFVRDHQSRDMFASFNTGGTVQWQVGLIPNSDSYVWTDVSSNVLFRMTAGNVLQIKDTGVSFAATDGVLTLAGLGNGNDENLTVDFDNAAANTITLASGTGANVLDMSAFAITVASCTGCGGGGGGNYKFSLTVDGGGSVLTTGTKGCGTIPLAGTIISATILSTDASFTSGSIAFDVWGNTLDTYPLAVGDSIVASDPPTMTTSTFDFDDDVSTWDTAVVNDGTAAGTTTLCAVVSSVTSITRAQLDLIIQP